MSQETQATLRTQIAELVSQFAKLSLAPAPFLPGLSPVPPSGKLLGEGELQNMVHAALDGWLTTGRFNAEFEQKLAKFIGVKNLITVNSGSSANLVAFSTLTSPKLGERAIQKGDEVIGVAAGFPTTVNPILQFGAVPVFVDVDPLTHNIDAHLIEAAIGPKTKAIMVTGNPVRAEMRELSLTPSESRVHFGLDPERPTLLIAGGSLGARAINEATLAALPAFAKAGIQLIWHTGANYFADIQAQLAAMPESAKPAMHLASFLTDMPIAYRAASLAVVRAGALTLAELIATRTPAIVAPSPYVAEDHQTHNARALENAGAALVIKDAELTAELAQAVLSLIYDPTQLDAMRAGLATLETPNAAERIAAEAIALAQAYAISPMLPLPGPIPFTPKPTPILV
jgi:hypothetical protein